MIRPHGILWRGRSAIDGGPIVAIVTSGTSNRKTGDMAQVWIMREDVPPHVAAREGLDSSVCGSCPHRGDGVRRSCYVVLVRAPLSVWKAYKAGRYAHVKMSDFDGARVRWGAYGDPGALPWAIITEVTARASRWTGYTHQWRSLPSYWTRYLMASCDSEQDFQDARARGWRTFRVRSSREGRENMLPGEISCPASGDLGPVNTSCSKCSLCSGSNARTVQVPSISILGHGPLLGS